MITEADKEEDYTGRFFIEKINKTDKYMYRIIGNINALYAEASNTSCPWIVIQTYSFSKHDHGIHSGVHHYNRYQMEVLIHRDNCIETDSNWVPLKKEFVIEKVGFYKSRSGRKVFCYCIEYDTKSTHPVHCVFVDRKDYTERFTVRLSGGYCLGTPNPAQADIVGPWEDE